MMLAVIHAPLEDAGKVVEALKSYCAVVGYGRLNDAVHVAIRECRIKLRDMWHPITQALISGARISEATIVNIGTLQAVRVDLTGNEPKIEEGEDPLLEGSTAMIRYRVTGKHDVRACIDTLSELMKQGAIKASIKITQTECVVTVSLGNVVPKRRRREIVKHVRRAQYEGLVKGLTLA